MPKTIPRLVYSSMTKRFYIATRYKDLGDGKFQATTKYDITDQIEAMFPIRAELQATSEVCPECSYPRLRPDKLK